MAKPWFLFALTVIYRFTITIKLLLKNTMHTACKPAVFEF